jgi:hypothetical protein
MPDPLTHEPVQRADRPYWMWVQVPVSREVSTTSRNGLSASAPQCRLTLGPDLILQATQERRTAGRARRSVGGWLGPSPGLREISALHLGSRSLGPSRSDCLIRSAAARVVPGRRVNSRLSDQAGLSAEPQFRTIQVCPAGKASVEHWEHSLERAKLRTESGEAPTIKNDDQE